jgi:GTPase involved in cell partitioning and DNA repair
MAFSRENYGSSIFKVIFFIKIEVPDGGDGGDGGDVYFRSTGRLSSLYDLRRAHFYGNNGKYGLVSDLI